MSQEALLLVELKAKAYDTLAIIEQCQKQLQDLNRQIVTESQNMMKESNQKNKVEESNS